MHKISVIIPIYNVEKYLHKCVDSVINQTYTDLEIILVDDGSPDNCPAICDEYAKKDNRIVVVHKQNGGLSDARNKGIEVSTGNYITFLDSDDYLELDALEIFHSRMIKDGSDLAVASVFCIDELGNGIASINDSIPIKDEVITGDAGLNNLLIEKYWYYVIACSKLYKRELFNDLSFVKGKLHEDEFMVHKIFHKCKKISCIQKPLYMYLQRSASITNTNYSINRLDSVEAFLDRYWFFVSINKKTEAAMLLSTTCEFMRKGYDRLDFSDPKVKERFYSLNDEIKKAYKNTFHVKIGIKKRIVLTMYNFSIPLYAKLRRNESNSLIKYIKSLK